MTSPIDYGMCDSPIEEFFLTGLCSYLNEKEKSDSRARHILVAQQVFLPDHPRHDFRRTDFVLTYMGEKFDTRCHIDLHGWQYHAMRQKDFIETCKLTRFYVRCGEIFIAFSGGELQKEFDVKMAVVESIGILLDQHEKREAFWESAQCAYDYELCAHFDEIEQKAAREYEAKLQYEKVYQRAIGEYEQRYLLYLLTGGMAEQPQNGAGANG